MTIVAGIVLAAADALVDDVAVPLISLSADDTLLEWQVREMQRAGIDVIEVVLGCQADVMIPLVSRDDVEPVVDARWKSGPGSWLRTGASATPRDSVAAVVLDITEPRPAAVIRRVLEARSPGVDLVCASCAGADASPWVLDALPLAVLRTMRDDAAGVAELAARRRWRCVRVEVGDAELMRITSVEDVARFRGRLAAS